MRRICTGSGTSMPMAAAATARSSSSRSANAGVPSPLSLRVLGDNAAGWSSGSARATAAAPTPSTAASDRAFVAHERRRRRQQLRDVGGVVVADRPEIDGVVERHDPRLSPTHDHVVGVEVAVHDPGCGPRRRHRSRAVAAARR